MKELTHAKTTQDGSSGQAWYSFCSDVFDSHVADATVLRLFFAPVYLVYDLGTERSRCRQEQEKWFEHYQETVKKAVLEDDYTLPHSAQLQARIRLLEKLLCSSVRDKADKDVYAYFSKNDRVKNHPERFAAAFFPENGGLHMDLLDYYHALMDKLFSGFPELLDACIDRLEKRNRDTVWYRFPTPDCRTGAVRDNFARVDAAANLLYRFAILSAARAIEADPKEKPRQGVIPDIFHAARQLLEVEDQEPALEDHLSIPLSRGQLLRLCSCAADSRNSELIDCLDEICAGCPSPGAASSVHRQDIQHLLQKLRQYNTDCGQRLVADYDMYCDDIPLMAKIRNLEKYWKQQLHGSAGDP